MTVNFEQTIRAVALQNEGHHQEAELLLKEQITNFPGDPLALYSLAVIEHRRANNEAALGYLGKALELWPAFALAQKAKALIASARTADNNGRSSQTLSRPFSSQPSPTAESFDLQKAQADPETTEQGAGSNNNPSVRPNLDARILHALSLHHAGQHDEATLAFEALALDDPENFVITYSLAVLAHQKGQALYALEIADRALTLAETAENQSLVQFMRGTLLMGLGLFDDALFALDRAIALKPDNSQASCNKASILQLLHRESEAVQCLVQAYANDPANPLILNNLGVSLTIFKQHAAAVPYFNRLLAIDPNYELAEGYRFFAKLQACDWSEFDEHRASITQGIREGRMVVNPLAFMAMSDDPEDHLRCSQIFSRRRYPLHIAPLWRGERYRHRRIRVGYLSPDFREHAVGGLLAGIIEQHDTSRIETYAFSLGIDDRSSIRRRYKIAFEHFLDCQNKLTHEIAGLIRAAEIDVLVDLAGYTADSKTDILAMRPAPVQVNYLGFSGTMGTPYIDYIVADSLVVPEKLEAYYMEKVLRLPHCYLPLDDSIIPHADPGSRSDHNLPRDGLVFCSFNHDYKINPPIWRIWMDLLREYRGSVLWLVKLNQDSEANLRKACNTYDIDPSRLVFAERLQSLEKHLARYHHADVYLDTFPYNAHSTATDLARMGVPIVTEVGGSFASRVASSVIATYTAESSLWAVDCGQDAGGLSSLAHPAQVMMEQHETAHPNEDIVLARYRSKARRFAAAAKESKPRVRPSVDGLTSRHARSLEALFHDIASRTREVA